MKFILNKRFRGRRVVFVLVSRPERRRLRTVAPPSVTAVAALYVLRRLGRRSGVTAGEAADALPGDEIVADSRWQSTRAITIAAPPEQVWPWIVRGATLTGYEAVSHPSLPNYLALVSGSTHGISDDCTSCVVSGRSLADTLAAAGRTWKTYAEGLPRPGFTGASAGDYAKKPDPFVYFRNVLAQPAWLSRVVPFGQLAGDVAARRLPDFALVVPNLCNDMHDCSVATGDAWLRRNIVPLLSAPALTGGVVFVVFDEGRSDAGGGGTVEALALGPKVIPGAVSHEPTSHYGLLRTIEQAWNLPLLGRSAQAHPITGIWR